MGSVAVQVMLDKNLSDRFDAHVQLQPVSNPFRRTLGLLQFALDDLLLRLWGHPAKSSVPPVNEAKSTVHRVSLLVISDSSDAGFEQVGRHGGAEFLVDHHFHNTSYYLPVSRHVVASPTA